MVNFWGICRDMCLDRSVIDCISAGLAHLGEIKNADGSKSAVDFENMFDGVLSRYKRAN